MHCHLVELPPSFDISILEKVKPNPDHPPAILHQQCHRCEHTNHLSISISPTMLTRSYSVSHIKRQCIAEIEQPHVSSR